MTTIDIVPIFLAVIALFAGIINIFVCFVLKVLWSEIKATQQKQEKDINGVYKEMRKHQDSNDEAIHRVDEQLHQIKTQLVQIGLHLKIDFKEV